MRLVWAVIPLLIFSMIGIVGVGESFGQIQTIEIGFDQTIEFDNIKIHFSDIDVSRCQFDEECNSDHVTVIIGIHSGSMVSTSHMIPEKSTSFAKPYEIRVMDIQPPPPNAEKSDYVVTLEIALTPTLEDKQACGAGNYLIDGMCSPGKQIGPTEEEQISSTLFSILLGSIGAGINIGLIILVTWNKRKIKNVHQEISTITNKTPVKEKHLKIFAILVVIIIPIFIILNNLATCTDVECEQFDFVYFVSVYFSSLSGMYLSLSLIGIPVGLLAISSGYFSMGYVLVHLLPWIILILINYYSEKMSILRILYWWVILSSIASLLFMTAPFPVGGPL